MAVLRGGFKGRAWLLLTHGKDACYWQHDTFPARFRMERTIGDPYSY